MKRAATVIAAALLVVAGVALARTWMAAPQPWSVLLIVVEPPPRAWLEPEGPAPRTPRLDRLGGAGVRLPLQAPSLSAGEWLGAVLGGAPPQRSLLRTSGARGWLSVGGSQVPVDPALAERFDRFAQGVDAETTVDAVLDGVGQVVTGGRARTLVVAVLRPDSAAQLERATARLIDGTAPWLPPAQTMVVLVDRGMRSAVLVAPSRPEDLGVSGALGPGDLGDAVARWLRLPLE